MRIFKLLLSAAFLLVSSAFAFSFIASKSEFPIIAPLDLSQEGASVSVEFRPNFMDVGKKAFLHLLYPVFIYNERPIHQFYDENFETDLFSNSQFPMQIQVQIYELDKTSARLIADEILNPNAQTKVTYAFLRKFGEQEIMLFARFSGFGFRLENKKYKAIITNLKGLNKLNGRFSSIQISPNYRKF